MVSKRLMRMYVRGLSNDSASDLFPRYQVDVTGLSGPLEVDRETYIELYKRMCQVPLKHITLSLCLEDEE